MIRSVCAAGLLLAAAAQAAPVPDQELSGSYRTAAGRTIDVAPMDEVGGQLTFIDQSSRRFGVLAPAGTDRYTVGPTLAQPAPAAIVAMVARGPDGRVTGLRWTEHGTTETAQRSVAPRIEDVTVRNGDVTLRGALWLPPGPGPHPAVVFAHGAGDATRNAGVWNAFFVRQGLAVLSLDKRGAGQSGGDWRQAGMDELAGDVLAGVRHLAGRRDIDARRIGLHGSSQGGWSAPLAAVRAPGAVAFVIVRAGSAVPVLDTMLHEIAWSVRDHGGSEADAQAAIAGSRRLFALAGAPWPEFDAAAAPLRAQPWARHAWPVGMAKDGWSRAWSARNASFDPAPVLARLSAPTLWFLGDEDHNVPSDASARRLAAAGNPDLTLVRLPGAGHAFTETPIPHASHMVRGYWDVMETWLRARLRR